MRRFAETVLMVLLIGIGVIPLIADSRSGDTSSDTSGGVVVLSGFTAFADADGFAPSISGNLASLPTGSNRLLLVVLHYEVPEGTGATVESVTVGGIPIVAVIPEMTVRQRVWAGYLKESDLVTLPDPAVIVANFDSSLTYAQARVGIFARVDQTTPILASVVNGSDSSAQDIDFGSTPLAVRANDMGLYFLNSADTGLNTQAPPLFFTESFEAVAAIFFDAGGGKLATRNDVSITGSGMRLTNPVRYGVSALTLAYDRL